MPQDWLLLPDTIFDLLVWVVISEVFLHVISHFDNFLHFKERKKCGTLASVSSKGLKLVDLVN